MDSIGGSIRKVDKNTENGATTYTYDIRVGLEKTLYQNIALTTNNNKVQQLTIDVFPNFLEAFYDHWSRYSMRNLLVEAGPPEQMVVSIRSDPAVYKILAVCPELGIVIEWYGQLQGNPKDLICPIFTKNDTAGLNLTVTDLSSSLSLYSLGNDPNDLVLWVPIEDTLGMSITELYEKSFLNHRLVFR